MLAVGGYDGIIRIFNTATHAPVAALAGNEGNIWSLAFSPDGTILAAGGYKIVGLWNAGTHQLTTTLNLGTPPPATSTSDAFPDGLAFSRYGAILAVGWEGTLEFWNVAGTTSKAQ